MSLNLPNRESGAGYVPWNDRVILATAGMFVWLAAAGGLSLVYRPAREGRRLACLAVVSFFLLVLALGAVLLRGTQHGGVRTPPPAAQGERV
jgi:hypothetical protein